MSLIHLYYNPIDSDFEHLFDAFNTRSHTIGCTTGATNTAQHPNAFRPRVDVRESDESNLVTATFELPGLASEDIVIDLQQNRLTVSGAPTSSDAVDENGFTVRERRRGKFSRTLRLPFGTKPADVKAKLENGLLTVTFPKSCPGQAPQRIAIQ